MKNTIATLIAGLFATAAFAQTPAPAAPAATPTPTPAVAKADVKETKADTKADAKANVKLAKADTKHAKKVAHHHPMAHKDTTVAAAAPAPTAAK